MEEVIKEMMRMNVDVIWVSVIVESAVTVIDVVA